MAPLSPDSLRLGPYQIVRELGTGGMGTVYLGTVRESGAGQFGDLPAEGERVAIKAFHPHLVGTDDFAGRFRREAKIGAQLRHPNVVHTFDAGTAPLRGHETSYLAMEFVEGQTLRDLIAELGRVPEDLGVTVARQVCDGLASIHAAGITHRDLKPENVIITDDHRVKLMDLGVAKVRDASIRLSLTGQFLGSVHYASPEQFRDPESVDARTDLYALGILIHEMLTGTNPFYHQDLQVVLRRTLTEPPRRLSLVLPDVSPVLDQLVSNLAQKDPDTRIQTAKEVLTVLEEGEDSTWWQRQGRLEWEETGERIARRIPVERETPLIGREDELKRLRGAFDAATASERRIVFLEGEAGVGKTRLVDEFAAGLAEEEAPHGFTFGSCPPPGSGRPFHVFSEALLRELEGGDLLESLTKLLPEGAPVEEFAALVEGRPVVREPLSSDMVRSVFAAAFRGLAKEQPLLLIVEDMHLAGEHEVSLLAYLARDDRTSRIVLVVTYRPPVDGHPLTTLIQGARDARFDHVELRRLGPKEVGQLLRAALQSERLVQELGFRLLERTEGNPYFIFEVLRSLKHENVLRRRDDGSWTMSGTRLDIQVPETVRELLQETLARLPEEDREVLDLASVQGMDFDPGILAELLGVPRIALLKRLSRLERKHRLIRSVGRRCRFDHHQLQETLYDELMPSLREEYHALVGEALERQSTAVDDARSVELAHHFLEGRRPDAALAYVRAALDHTIATYATETAAKLAERFLELDDGETAGPELRTTVLLALAEVYDHEGRRAEQREMLDRAADEVERTAEAQLQRRVFERRLALHFQLGDFALAEEICREAFRDASRDKRRDDAIAAIGNLAGAMRCQGRYDEAVNVLRRALSWVQPVGIDNDLKRCLLITSLGLVQFNRGHVPSAQRLFLQGREMAGRFGMTKGEPMKVARTKFDDDFRKQFAGLARALGRYVESRIDAERTLLLGSALPKSTREAAVLLALGVLAGHLGQLGDARAALLAAVDRARMSDDARFESAVLEALGENAVQAGDTELARRRFGEALKLRRKIGYRPGCCESLLALGQVAALGGDDEAARTYLREASELAPMLEMPGIAALAGATAALLHAREGRRDKARIELEEAHRALGGGSALSVSSRAEGLYFAGLAARALGDEDVCQVYLWQAYEIIQEVADHMASDQRQAFLTKTSPNREIVAEIARIQ